MGHPGRPRAFWIPLESGIHGRRKTLDLAMKLDIDTYAAVGHLTALWAWNLQENETGDVTDVPPGILAHAAGFALTDGERVKQALIDSGWIVEEDGKLRLSGWRRLVEPRLRRLEAKREYEAKRREDMDAKTPSNSVHMDAKSTGNGHHTRREEKRREAKRENTQKGPRVRQEHRLIADNLIKQYEFVSGHRAPKATARLLSRQIARDPGVISKMQTALGHYRRHLRDRGVTEKQYIISTRNWFGQEQRWTEYDNPLEPATAVDHVGSLHEQHQPSEEDKALDRYHRYLDVETRAKWEALPPMERTRRVALASDDLRTRPEGKRLSTAALTKTAERVAIRALAADCPTFEEWTSPEEPGT